MALGDNFMAEWQIAPKVAADSGLFLTPQIVGALAALGQPTLHAPADFGTCVLREVETVTHGGEYAEALAEDGTALVLLKNTAPSVVSLPELRDAPTLSRLRELFGLQLRQTPYAGEYLTDWVVAWATRYTLIRTTLTVEVHGHFSDNAVAAFTALAAEGGGYGEHPYTGWPAGYLYTAVLDYCEARVNSPKDASPPPWSSGEYGLSLVGPEFPRGFPRPPVIGPGTRSYLVVEDAQPSEVWGLSEREPAGFGFGVSTYAPTTCHAAVSTFPVDLYQVSD